MQTNRPSIKKNATTAALYLLAGVITTVAVAWGCVFLDRGEFQFTGTQLGGWIALPDGLAVISISEHHVPGSRITSVYVWSWIDVDAPEELLARDERYQPAARLPDQTYQKNMMRSLTTRFGYPEVQLMFEARGWPMPALWCAPYVATSAGVERNRAIVCGIAIGEPAAATNNPADRAITLPMIPMWRGLAIDSLLFGVTWYILIALLLHARRFVRVQRGRCSRCGYVMQDKRMMSRGCPECGHGREV